MPCSPLRPAGRTKAVGPLELTRIGALAADTLARAVARGVHAAKALDFPGALPSWRDKFGG